VQGHGPAKRGKLEMLAAASRLSGAPPVFRHCLAFKRGFDKPGFECQCFKVLQTYRFTDLPGAEEGSCLDSDSSRFAPCSCRTCRKPCEQSEAPRLLLVADAGGDM